MNKNKPEIILSFVESDINYNETNRFISKWKNKVDHISISQIHNWTGEIHHSNSNYIYRQKDPCRLLWTDMVISWDGSIPLCCNDYENKIILGNIKENKIEDVWNSKSLRKIRTLHKKKLFQDILLCKDCEYNYHDKSNWWVSK